MTWMRDAETFYRERDAEIKVDVEKIIFIFSLINIIDLLY